MVIDFSKEDLSKILTPEKPQVTTQTAPISIQTTQQQSTSQQVDFSKIDLNQILNPTKPAIAPSAKPTTQKGFKWTLPTEIASTVLSPITGFIHGASGLRPIIGGPDTIYEQLKPEEKLEWDKKWGKPNEFAIPENKALSGIGDVGGMLYSVANIPKLLTKGAIKVFGVAKLGEIAAGAKGAVEHIFTPAVGAKGAIQHVITKGNIISHVIGPQGVKLFTPLAIGAGGQRALTESVNEIYDKGYLDPAVVGTEASIAAASVYAWPVLGAFLPRILGGSVSLAPLLLRYLPANIGGVTHIPELSSVYLKSATERIRPVGIVGQGWKMAALGLRETFKRLEKVSNKILPQAIKDHLDSINVLANWMDGMQRWISSTFSFPTKQFSGAGTYPHSSPIKPQLILQHFDMAPDWQPITKEVGKIVAGEVRPERSVEIGKVAEKTEKYLHNFGGGVNGMITHHQLADQFEKLAIQMKGSSHKVESKEAYRAQGIANMFRRRAGRLSRSSYDFINKNIDILTNIPNSRFRVTVPDPFGRPNPTPSMEGKFLIFLRDTFIRARNRNHPFWMVVRGAKMMASHLLLGTGNVFSGISVLNRLSFPLATEGPENVFLGINHARGNTELYKRFANLLGVQEPRKLLTEEGRLSKIGEEISKKSFYFYDEAEKIMLPATAIARWKSLMDKGVPYAQAVHQAVDFARQLRTSMDYDIPQFVRPSAIGNAATLMFQFFPFAFKSAAFASRLGLEEFANYVGYMTAIGGVKAIPFATVADRAYALYTGHSVINSLMANPVMNQILTGLPGLEFGVDLGSRHNWTQAFFDRMLGATAPPFISWSERTFNALFNLAQHPNGSNAIKAFRAASSLAFGYLETALDDDKHGALLDSHGFPIVKNPTKYELAITGLGGIPTRMSEMRALQQAEYEATQHGKKITGAAEDNYRRALQSGDPKQIIAARREARGAGVKYAVLSRIRSELKKPPAKRLLQKVPKRLRKEFKWLTDQLDQVNR